MYLAKHSENSRIPLSQNLHFYKILTINAHLFSGSAELGL